MDEANTGMIRFHYSQEQLYCNQSIHQIVSVNTIILNSSSWGVYNDFSRYLKLVESFDYPHSCIHLNLLAFDESEYESLKTQVSQSKPLFAYVTLLHPVKSLVERAISNQGVEQKSQKAKLAALRNLLVYSSLNSKVNGVFWMDANMAHVPHNLVREILDSGHDIVTPHSKLKHRPHIEHDLSTWIGPRAKPTEEEFIGIRDGSLEFTPHNTPATKLIRESNANERSERYVEVTSVGGAFLFVRADIHRLGISFPPYYAVGAQDWDMKEGYDGIDTEGICFLARTVGFKCWGMPHEKDEVLLNEIL
ncbi:MAG: hypothetical protein SGCHY_000052 [Lobulomycetales sp.]